MGLIRRRVESSLELRASVVNPLHPRDPGLAALFPVDDSDTGVEVTPATAMTHSAVWAAVNLLARTVASLPLVVNRKLAPKGRERDPNHPLYDILHSNANQDQTSFEWREMTQGHLCLRGNGYSEIMYDDGGRVRELVPNHPDKIHPERAPDGKLWYIPESGAAIPAARMLHLRGLASNGIMGLSVIHAARRSIGVAIAAEKFGGKFFANSARPSGVLKMPGSLDEASQKRLKASWDAAHSGVENASKTAVLEQGLEYQQIGLSPDDAQFLGTIAASVPQVARWFGVPPHMIADLDRATFSNIESQGIDFVVHSIRPWLTRWEQRLETQLLTAAERKVFEIRFIVEGLLRGDSTARSAFYSSQFGIGAINRNEIRELEGLNPIPEDEDGDTFFVPLNMIPADQAKNFYGGSSSLAPAARSIRSRREVRARTEIAHGFVPMFEELSQRIVRAEVRELKKGVETYLTAGSPELFFEWIDRRYAFDGEFRKWIATLSQPAMISLATVIGQRASAEIGASGMTEAQIAEFSAGLAASFANRHTGSSRGQIRKLATTMTGDELAPALELKIEEWPAERPARMAAREAIKASRAVAREAFRSGGITRIQWVSSGDNCPFCDSLDGKIVGIEGSFAEPGDVLTAEGRAPLSISQKVLHAPIHAGCDCDIVPA